MRVISSISMSQAHRDLCIAFFSSSDFTIPIVQSIIDNKGNSLYDVAIEQVEALSAGAMVTDSIVYPHLHKFIDAVRESEELLSGYIITHPLIITQPDREHRGKVLKNPISQFASHNNLNLYQPQRIKKNIPEFVDTMSSYGVTLGLVASFGQILPFEVINCMRYGIINWHPSLLPLYRGPTPMQTVLRNGEQSSGLTWITMDEGMDSGDIIVQIKQTIPYDQTLVSMSKVYGMLGADTWALAICMQIITRTSDIIRSNTQDHTAATYTKMLSKEDKYINRDTITAQDLINHYRAYKGFPSTVMHSLYFGSDIRIDELDCTPYTTVADEIVFEDEEFVQTKNRKVFCKVSDGYVEIIRITLLQSGKSIVLNGFEFNVGGKNPT